MAVVVNDVIRCAVLGDFRTNDDVANVYWYKVTTLLDGDNAVVAGEINLQLEQALGRITGTLHTDTVWGGCTYINQTQDEFMDEIDINVTNLAAGEPTSAQVCALVVARTAKPRVQGRKYMGVMSENVVDGGDISGAALTELRAFADDYIEEFTGVSGNVYTPGAAKIGAEGAVLGFEAFTRRKVIVVTRTQRRRTPGRGS